MGQGRNSRRHSSGCCTSAGQQRGESAGATSTSCATGAICPARRPPTIAKFSDCRIRRCPDECGWGGARDSCGSGGGSCATRDTTAAASAGSRCAAGDCRVPGCAGGRSGCAGRAECGGRRAQRAGCTRRICAIRKAAFALAVSGVVREQPGDAGVTVHHHRGGHLFAHNAPDEKKIT